MPFDIFKMADLSHMRMRGKKQNGGKKFFEFEIKEEIRSDVVSATVSLNLTMSSCVSHILSF